MATKTNAISRRNFLKQGGKAVALTAVGVPLLSSIVRNAGVLPEAKAADNVQDQTQTMNQTLVANQDGSTTATSWDGQLQTNLQMPQVDDSNILVNLNGTVPSDSDSAYVGYQFFDEKGASAFIESRGFDFPGDKSGELVTRRSGRLVRNPWRATIKGTATTVRNGDGTVTSIASDPQVNLTSYQLDNGGNNPTRFDSNGDALLNFEANSGVSGNPDLQVVADLGNGQWTRGLLNNNQFPLRVQRAKDLQTVRVKVYRNGNPGVWAALCTIVDFKNQQVYIGQDWPKEEDI